jgi:hypothetical protein
MKLTVEWSVTSTVTYRTEINPEDVGLPVDATLDDVYAALSEDGDQLAGFEGAEHEVSFSNEGGREVQLLEEVSR